MFERLTITLSKNGKHGRSIRDEADLIIPLAANHSYFDQLAFEPSPVCLGPDYDVVVWVNPEVISKRHVQREMQFTSRESRVVLVWRIHLLVVILREVDECQ